MKASNDDNIQNEAETEKLQQKPDRQEDNAVFIPGAKLPLKKDAGSKSGLSDTEKLYEAPAKSLEMRPMANRKI